MDVFEISGEGWNDAKFGFRSYQSIWYPEHDICSEAVGHEICDLVILEQVLEHVEFPEQALKHCFQMVRSGGRILVTTPFLLKFHPDPMDLYRWTEDGMRILLQRAGFAEVVTGSWGNRECLIADMTPDMEWTWYQPEQHSLVNEPQFPIVVWAHARKPVAATPRETLS